MSDRIKTAAGVKPKTLPLNGPAETYTGLSESSLRRRAAEGKFALIKINGRRMLVVETYDRFIDSQVAAA